MASGALKLVHSDAECEVYEVEEDRPFVRLRYDGMNAFLGEYMGKMRRQVAVVIPAPVSAAVGDLIDVEVMVDDVPTFTLHAEILGRWPEEDSELTEVLFFAGELTDRMVRPLVEQALGTRHASALLTRPRA
jgi:hypothetical protein